MVVSCELFSPSWSSVVELALAGQARSDRPQQDATTRQLKSPTHTAPNLHLAPLTQPSPMSFKAQHAKLTDSRAERREVPLDQIHAQPQPEPSLAGKRSNPSPFLSLPLPSTLDSAPYPCSLLFPHPIPRPRPCARCSDPAARHAGAAHQAEGQAGQVDRRAQAQVKGDREGYGARSEARQAP